ncbi:MAG: class I SAM-dependent DNA methyltransferase [Suilimivivens sp.]
MEAYTDFAEVYDTFMDDTPYEEWADFVAGLIEKYGISKPVRGERAPGGASEDDRVLASERNLVVDLGCGTGTLTELLYQKGYDMIGIDNSEEMLRIAMDKKDRSKSGILYLCQDMRDMDLYSTVGTVVSVCDSINYLLEDEDVEDTFSLVSNYLYPGGIFIFDFNTLYKYKTVIGDTTIAENRDNCSFIWENYYHEEEHINEYDLTVFVKEEEKELFRRFSETHYQRGYTLEEMKQFVKKAGMEILTVLDADTHEEPDAESERIYLVCRERKK